MGDLGDILLALFWTPRNVVIVYMAWSLALIVGKAIPDSWVVGYKKHIFPVLTAATCLVAVWAPGLRPGLPKGQAELAPGTGISGEEIGWRLALGLILSVGSIALPIIIMAIAEKKLSPKVVRAIRKILL